MQPKNIETLCNSVTKVVLNDQPGLTADIVRTSEKFKNILKMFAQCHKFYDASFLSDDSIEQLSKFKCTHLKFNTNFIYMHYCYLGQAITNFMDAFRKSFPKATVPVKMHMLEEHTVAWVQKWHVGFGLLGEQGAESIHAKFNALHRTYCSIHDKLQHYQCVMKEHLISIAPQNVAAIPVITKRPKYSME